MPARNGAGLTKKINAMGFTTRKLIKTESQPLYVPAGFTGGQIYFPDNQYIRDKKLMAIEVTSDLNQLFGLPPQQYVDGTPLTSFQFNNNCWLTLESYAGVQYVRKKLITSFQPYLLQGVGNVIPPQFIGQRTNFPKCYIEVPNIPATLVKQVIILDIYFTEISDEVTTKQLSTGFGEKK